jgi:TM2 domain-containing membrane protein YozV
VVLPMSKHKSYLVPLSEMNETHKSPLAGFWLAFLFGQLGVHRFYFQRHRSGIMILLVNILSLGLALFVTVPLVLVEAIYYARLVQKRHNSTTDSLVKQSVVPSPIADTTGAVTEGKIRTELIEIRAPWGVKDKAKYYARVLGDNEVIKGAVEPGNLLATNRRLILFKGFPSFKRYISIPYGSIGKIGYKSMPMKLLVTTKQGRSIAVTAATTTAKPSLQFFTDTLASAIESKPFPPGEVVECNMDGTRIVPASLPADAEVASTHATTPLKSVKLATQTPDRIPEDKPLFTTLRAPTIIDVSNTEPLPIPQQAQLEQDESKTWLELLHKPYERQGSTVSQLHSLIDKLYDALAGYIDLELKASGTSLRQFYGRSTQTYDYYGNTLYTIYCIAEGEVMSHYKPRGYDNGYSYQILTQRLGEALAQKVKEYCNRYAASFPPATEETNVALRLTSSGQDMVWWDMDGTLRKSNTFSSDQALVLDRTPSRSTIILNISELRGLILVQYLASVEELRKQFHSNTGWSKKQTSHLKWFFDLDRQFYWDGNDDITYLLKICEQTIRENIPYSRMLKTDAEIAHLKRVWPKDSTAAVLKVATTLQREISLSDKTVRTLREQNPTAWKSDVKDIEDKSLGDVLSILRRYEDGEVCAKVAKEIIKHRQDKPAQLAAIYATHIANSALDEWTAKQLHKLIHADQLTAYQALVADNAPINTALLDQLASLTKAPLRRVVLDGGKIRQAYEDHNHAVRSVTDYLGEDEAALDFDKNTSSVAVAEIHPSLKSRDVLFGTSDTRPTVMLSEDQKDFLRTIESSHDGISLADATAFAKLLGKPINGYIQVINKLLYNAVEDQVILQVDGKVILEQEYRAVVKEMI